MNKNELVKAVAEKVGTTQKEAKDLVDAVLDTISSAVTEGDKVTLVGFGNFGVKERAGRNGRNPATGEPIVIPARKVPYFKPSTALKDSVK